MQPSPEISRLTGGPRVQSSPTRRPLNYLRQLVTMNRPESVIIPVAVLFLFGTAVAYVVEGPKDDYWIERTRILETERNQMLGGDVKLGRYEELANQALMKLKRKEVDDGFENPNSFLPSQNFLTVAEEIRKSEVYQMIKKLPKGAVLHAHDTAFVSSDYIFWNITFRPNLYVCDVDGVLRFKFFDKPNMTECGWKLLNDLRKVDKVGIINQRINEQLTMITKNPDQAYPDVNAAWDKFISIFIFITPMLTYRPVYEDHFYQGLLELYNDNVQYLELRSTLPTLYELDGTEYGPLEVAKMYKDVADRFVRDHPDFVGMKLIYAPSRKVSSIKLDEYLSTARKLVEELPDFVIGFDLVGQEDKGEPLEVFADKLRALGDDVQLFFHAGETNWYGMSTDDNLIDAVLLNTKRIGHGYALVKHPKVMEIVRKRNIAIEVAPISNQVLNLVKDLRNHPGSLLFSEDYPVVISNDDPGLWGAKGLSYDFYEAFVGMMSRDSDLRSLKKLALNSIEHSSLNVDEKKRAMKIWSQHWDKFISEFKNKN